jgi:hypothetical protein
VAKLFAGDFNHVEASSRGGGGWGGAICLDRINEMGTQGIATSSQQSKTVYTPLPPKDLGD